MTTTTDRRPSVAETIRQQIGTGTLMRIGARNLTAEGRALHLNFTYTTKGHARRVMHATITLTPMDDYTVTIRKTKTLAGRRYPTETVAVTEGLHFPDLPRHLQRQAGEADSLGLRPTWEK